MSAAAYFAFRTRLDSALQENATSTIALLQNEISSWFGPLSGEVDAASRAAPLFLKTPAGIAPFLASVLKAYPDISDIYWAGQKSFKDGGFFIAGSGWNPPKDYDQDSRGWFIEAQKAEGLYLTDPYLDMITNKVVISITKKVVYPEGALDGAVGMDLFITRVGELVAAKKLSANGKTYLVNKDGLFITADKIDSVLKDNVFDRPGLAGIKTDVLGKAKSFGILLREGVYYTSIDYPGTTWKLLSYGPVADIYGPLNVFLLTISVVALICLSVAVILAGIVARSISRPVALIALLNMRFAQGDFALEGFDFSSVARMRVRSDEIGDATRAIDEMITSISKSIKAIYTTATEVAGGAGQLSTTAQVLSQGTTEQAAKQERKDRRELERRSEPRT
jgi:methyl-accepting chemotaxis protein